MTREEFKVLFDTHFDAIRRYLYFRSGDTTVSTDLAQDTFLKIWEKQFSLDSVRDVGLLYKIAGDLFVSHYRRDRLSRGIMKELSFDLEGAGPEEDLHFKELQDKYEKVLARMPEKHRIVFLMSRMEGLKYQEIASRLSLSVKAIEKRMTAALSLLRKELKPHEKE
ncbi:MAG: sigma-70 family RNA polymerase sigma factor [Bacteroidota bacterium]